MDLFSKIKGKFDLIIFNPPYLPLDELEDLDYQISKLKEFEVYCGKDISQAVKHRKKKIEMFHTAP